MPADVTLPHSWPGSSQGQSLVFATFKGQPDGDSDGPDGSFLEGRRPGRCRRPSGALQ
jgi:hypothetical protein